MVVIIFGGNAKQEIAFRYTHKGADKQRKRKEEYLSGAVIHV